MKTTNFLLSIKKQATVLASLILLFLVGCSGDYQLGLPPQHGNPPPPPVVVGVENLNGAAIIHFKAPVQYDILAITATYEINNVERVVRTSIFNNTLKVEGFGRAGEHTVLLRTVDNSRNESEPVSVTINPLAPPIELIFETLDVVDSFGGISVSWENANRNNIMVSVFAKDEFGLWGNLHNFFSSEMYGRGTIRGLDTLETAFRVQLRDRWDNFSDILEVVRTPLFEEHLPRSRFREVTPLPRDAPTLGAMAVSRIWNGNVTVADQIWHSQNMPEPGWFVTFDMGQLAQLSRFRIWQRRGVNHQFTFQHNNLYRYTVYGAEEITLEMRLSGCRDGWTRLVDVVSHRPSGHPPGNLVLTDEDREFANHGEEIEIPIEAPPVRFIRIFMAETWGQGYTYQIQQIDFYGQIIEAFFP